MSIMNLPLLIVGGNSSLRKKEAQKLAASSSSTFDITILNAGQTKGIDGVRALRSKFSHRPFESSFQTFVISESQNLTLEAQNALLKSLEEPNPSTKFILTAPTAEGLLSTITSRCQKLELAVKEEETNVSDQLETYLKMCFYERWQRADKLDIDLWVASWRRLLLGWLGVGEANNLSRAEGLRVLNYLKLVNKLKTFLKRKASSRLIKAIILLEAPQLSVDSK